MDDTQVTPGVGMDGAQADPQTATPAPEATEGEVVAEPATEAPAEGEQTA